MSEVVSEAEMVLRRAVAEMARCENYINQHREAIDHHTKSRDSLLQEQQRIAGFTEMLKAFRAEADSEGGNVSAVEVARLHLANCQTEISRIEADAAAEIEKKNQVLLERSKLEIYLEVAARFAVDQRSS